MTLAVVSDAISAIRGVLPADITVTDSPTVRVEGTGHVAVQVLHGGQWRIPSHGSAHNEVLHLNIYADVTRTNGEPVKADADSRAWGVYELVDDLLHDVDHDLSFVTSAYRRNGPTLTNVPEGDGAILLSVQYEVRH